MALGSIYKYYVSYHYTYLGCNSTKRIKDTSILQFEQKLRRHRRLRAAHHQQHSTGQPGIILKIHCYYGTMKPYNNNIIIMILILYPSRVKSSLLASKYLKDDRSTVYRIPKKNKR